MLNEKKKTVALDPKKRVLFLTKDLKAIRDQLDQKLDLKMSDLKPNDLLDDINTDVMTPAWVCFQHDPIEIAKRAYAGLLFNGERVIRDQELFLGNFQAIVSGKRKGTGSSRETAAQCERFCGVRLVFAESFAPIHARNNINLGQIMGDYKLLERLQSGEEIQLDEFLKDLDPFLQKIVKAGGLFNFLEGFSQDLPLAFSEEEKTLRPMTMAQKIMAKKIAPKDYEKMMAHESVIAQVDAGYSHEFTSAQVHQFLKTQYGDNYQIKNSRNFAAFEDHLIYADQVKKYLPFMEQIKELRKLQKEFIRHNKLRDYSATKGISPGICHEVARQDFILPSDFVQATDSHTCMGGALNSFAYGVGATEYAALLKTGLAVVQVPESIKFELVGTLKNNCSAKDIILSILKNFTTQGKTLNKVMEFVGEGMLNLSIDERATLCNMATECGAKTGICTPDQKLVEWLEKNRHTIDHELLEEEFVWPDENCSYEGGAYTINLDEIAPMVAHPGNPDKGIPSDPTNGEFISNLGDIKIDIAYGGSCTAGKFDDIKMYAKAVSKALEKGLTIPEGVNFYIQYGSRKVESYSKEKGFHALFQKAKVKIIPPGCGACIGCGPGVSENQEQVTVSAINRNFQGRSGPGKLYLASPLTVAASAFAGKIVAFDDV